MPGARRRRRSADQFSRRVRLRISLNRAGRLHDGQRRYGRRTYRKIPRRSAEVLGVVGPPTRYAHAVVLYGRAARYGRRFRPLCCSDGLQDDGGTKELRPRNGRQRRVGRYAGPELAGARVRADEQEPGRLRELLRRGRVCQLAQCDGGSRSCAWRRSALYTPY